MANKPNGTKVTSPKIASQAGTALGNPKTPKNLRGPIASALAQKESPPKRKK